jgi:hypothetical protein
MSAFDSNDSRDEALWKLLGRAREVEPSPYFARKVLRAIEEDAATQPGWWRIFLRTIVPVGACASLAVLALVGIQSSPVPTPATAEMEFETIQNLDLLVANYESSIWLDPSSSSR